MSRFIGGSFVLKKEMIENLELCLKGQVFAKLKDLPIGNTYVISYGYDHVCGYFVQLEYPIDVPIVLDIDSLFDKMSGYEFSRILGEFIPNDRVAQTAGVMGYLGMEI